MQLMRKVSNRVEKPPNRSNIKEQHLELFWGEGQQSSHGAGGAAWTKITNAKGGVTEKVLRTFGIK